MTETVADDATCLGEHPDQVALIYGILNEPEDDARWLIWADWLEDHEDDGGAEYLRNHFRELREELRAKIWYWRKDR